MVLLCKALFLYVLAMDEENIINLSAGLLTMSEIVKVIFCACFVMVVLVLNSSC